MKDELISRQAAIDAICEDGVQLERQGQYMMTMVERKQRDADILDALPSAQFTTRQMDAIKMADALFDAFERAQTLLKAAYDLLNKQEKSHYVLNLLEETVFYDNEECDGSCLMDDIKYWFDEFSETDLFGDDK